MWVIQVYKIVLRSEVVVFLQVLESWHTSHADCASDVPFFVDELDKSFGKKQEDTINFSI